MKFPEMPNIHRYASAVRVSDIASRNALVEQFMPLVHHVAKKLWKEKSVRRLGCFEDLVSCGYQGLIKAAELYDPRHASKSSFKTYAFMCILRFISRSADEGTLIRIPASAMRQLYQSRIANAKPELIERIHRALDVHQSSETGDLGVGKWEEIERDEEEETPLPEAASMFRQAVPLVREVIKYIPGRHRRLLTMMFGLGTKAATPIDQIASALGLTMEAMAVQRQCALASFRDAAQKYRDLEGELMSETAQAASVAVNGDHVHQKTSLISKKDLIANAIRRLGLDTSNQNICEVIKAEHNVEVDTAYVSMVRSKCGLQKFKRTVGKGSKQAHKNRIATIRSADPQVKATRMMTPGLAQAATTVRPSEDIMIRLRDLAREAGGIEKLSSSLKELEKYQVLSA